jgi:predicted metal-dependent phosphoesterase TrpH
MLIDIHNHTKPCSQCAYISADELVREVMRYRLDAICVTDHFLSWGGHEARALARERHNFTVFAGVEAATTLGDVLVFGLDENFAKGCDGAELLRYVDERGGATVLAHPFRQGGSRWLWEWLQKHDLAPGAGADGGQMDLPGLSRKRVRHPDLIHLHAVETFNGEVNASELARAEQLAASMGLPSVGGSDAHSLRQVGRTATEFAQPVESEAELAREIRAGRVRPVRLR